MIAADRTAAERAFPGLLVAAKGAEQDFEFYPTSPRMLDVIARHLPEDAMARLTDDERRTVSIAKVAASQEVEHLVAIIERLSGERVVESGEPEPHPRCRSAESIGRTRAQMQIELWSLLDELREAGCMVRANAVRSSILDREATAASGVECYTVGDDTIYVTITVPA